MTLRLNGSAARQRHRAESGTDRWNVDLVLVVVGVRPDTDLLVRAGPPPSDRDQLLPLDTTAHKQGRVAGENAAGGAAYYAGSLGTQVVKVFDLAAAQPGVRTEVVPTGRTPPLRPRSRSSATDPRGLPPDLVPLRLRPSVGRRSDITAPPEKP